MADAYTLFCCRGPVRATNDRTGRDVGDDATPVSFSPALLAKLSALRLRLARRRNNRAPHQPQQLLAVLVLLRAGADEAFLLLVLGVDVAGLFGGLELGLSFLTLLAALQELAALELGGLRKANTSENMTGLLEAFKETVCSLVLSLSLSLSLSHPPSSPSRRTRTQA